MAYSNEVNTLTSGEETMCQWTHLVLVFGFTNPPGEGSTLSPAHAATPQGEARQDLNCCLKCWVGHRCWGQPDKTYW
jgi:hypothetical protein